MLEFRKNLWIIKMFTSFLWNVQNFQKMLRIYKKMFIKVKNYNFLNNVLKLSENIHLLEKKNFSKQTIFRVLCCKPTTNQKPLRKITHYSPIAISRDCVGHVYNKLLPAIPTTASWPNSVTVVSFLCSLVSVFFPFSFSFFYFFHILK